MHPEKSQFDSMHLLQLYEYQQVSNIYSEESQYVLTRVSVTLQNCQGRYLTPADTQLAGGGTYRVELTIGSF